MQLKEGEHDEKIQKLKFSPIKHDLISTFRNWLLYPQSCIESCEKIL